MKDLKTIQAKQSIDEVRSVTILIQEVHNTYAMNGFKLSNEAREGLGYIYKGLHQRLNNVSSVLTGSSPI